MLDNFDKEKYDYTLYIAKGYELFLLNRGNID